jgi:Flp pilus assembly protein protease CpaA
MFTISFYIFSLFLSYTDFTRFIVPNVLVGTLALFLLLFGMIENRLDVSAFVLPFIILLFFIAIMLINRQLILGGGDIKYMMLVGLYLGIPSFAVFLIVSGILQTLALLYVQQVRKRKIAPMVPLMFLAVIIVQILENFGIDLYYLKGVLS